MTTTPITSKGEQAKSQLIAAAIAQFGEYGLHATTRDIAAQAGQNIAAITYYFGSKDDLYLACAQWIADFIEHNFRPHAQAAEALFTEPVPDKAAMRSLILGACQNMILLLTQDDTVNLSKFISREQLSPTPALPAHPRSGDCSTTLLPDTFNRRLYRPERRQHANGASHPRAVGRSSRFSPWTGNGTTPRGLGRVRSGQNRANY